MVLVTNLDSWNENRTDSVRTAFSTIYQLQDMATREDRPTYIRSSCNFFDGFNTIRRSSSSIVFLEKTSN